MLPYASTIFLSAFLLFLVQPLVAKQILPWFGGSAAVWTTCLLFFQSVLLAGYAYADATVRWLSPRRQVMVHAVLLVVSLATLPIIADTAWKPAGDSEPITRILGLLAFTIGLPYLLLSSTTPLLQAWYWRRFQSAVPYRLFALSNFASLLALIGYPTLFEPYLGGRESALTWSWLYGLFVVVCAVTGLLSIRALPQNMAAAAATSSDVSPADKPTMPRMLLWLTLSAMGSCLLLAVSNHITQNVASVPFLWVLPLSLYLITFIICFDHPRWYQRWFFLPLLAIGLPLMAYNIDSLDLKTAVPLFAAGLFVGCMFCHGELARLKPHPRYLTLFYLAVSIGGAIGALVMAIGAPLLLEGYYEMHIMVVALCVLGALVFWRSRALLAGTVALTVVVAMLAWQRVQDYQENVRVMERDFYGVTRVRDVTSVFPFRAMYHGSIMHGGQLLDEKLAMTPSSYFGPTSGYGRLFAALPEGQPRSVGVIGLGAGALASYVKPGDHWVFYEIDPIVAEVADREFTFMREARKVAKLELILGDGRLSLEREQPRGYDVLAIDAFSGDSIPMHLITREAMQAYVKHLKPDGAIVFQATNRYVDILPLIRRLADEFGMKALHVADWPNFREGPSYWLASTDQVIVTKNEAILAHAKVKEAGVDVPQRKELPTFTDDYYNLLRVLKWK